MNVLHILRIFVENSNKYDPAVLLTVQQLNQLFVERFPILLKICDTLQEDRSMVYCRICFIFCKHLSKILTNDPALLLRVRQLTLRRLMSYIYMEHPFLMFLDHTQRRSTVGRTPLDE